MIKPIITAVFFTLLATNSYAATIADNNKHLQATKLSNGVEGTYFANNTADGSNDATAFWISMGHAQGNRVYATTNLNSKIFKNDLTEKFASGDLLTAAPGYTSVATPGDWSTL
jgi:hypothetical protein